MSKSNLKSLALGQIGMLEATTGKDRFAYTISRIEDGKVYDGKGNQCGVYDGDDVIFITDKDLELSRITGAKISKVKQSMLAYFDGEKEEVSPDEVEESNEYDNSGTEEGIDYYQVYIDYFY